MGLLTNYFGDRQGFDDIFYDFDRWFNRSLEKTNRGVKKFFSNSSEVTDNDDNFLVSVPLTEFSETPQITFTVNDNQLHVELSLVVDNRRGNKSTHKSQVTITIPNNCDVEQMKGEVNEDGSAFVISIPKKPSVLKKTANEVKGSVMARLADLRDKLDEIIESYEPKQTESDESEIELVLDEADEAVDELKESFEENVTTDDAPKEEVKAPQEEAKKFTKKRFTKKTKKSEE